MGRNILIISIFIGMFLITNQVAGQRPILDEFGKETGLVNMNPDPDGELWIAGGLKPMTAQEEAAWNRLPKFKLSPKLRGRQLPPTCDNSTAYEFREIFNQIGGSCGQASGMGYHFTYERNLALGTTGADPENICAYGFTWNFVNGGSGSGSWPSAGYGIAKEMGCGHVIDFNNADNGGSGTAWMDGYEGYYNANDCHIVEQVTFSKDDIDELKNWFYDKGTGTGKNGGCITFGSSTSFSNTTVQSGPFQGEKLATSLSSGSSHAMTLSGYSDEVGYDLNGDGKITNDIDITRDGIVDIRDREEGAWQLVNSWGGSWNNSGKIWVLYSGFGGQKITGITVEQIETKLMIKATVTHSSRNSLELTTGFSEDINATSPDDTKGYGRAFNEVGGSYPMEGSGGSSTLEIGLDVTEFYKQGMAQGKFFLIAESSSGTVESMSLMDYTSGDVVETECDQTNVSISGTTYLSVVKIFSPLTTLSPNGGEKWERERIFDVKWSTILDGDVKIELLKGSSVHSVIADAVPASDVSFAWEIPNDQDLGEDYKVKITSLSDPTKIDESDEVFGIEEKSMLDLTSPNGGQELEKGSEVEITWDDNLSGNVTIGLFQGENMTLAIAEDIASQSPYKWKITDNVPSAMDYKIRVTSVDKDWLFDENENTITIRNPLVTKFPYVQDFDDFEESTVVFRDYWEQLNNDDLDWTVWTGKTPTKEDDQGAATGPDNDHTSGSGNYLYVESSGSNNPDKKADFVTPIFDLRYLEKGTCTFWYHMFSDNEGNDEMGDLYVDLNVDGTWEEGVLHFNGDAGDVWKSETIDLTDCHTKKIQFRFRAVTGDGWASDVCIDDFSIDGQTAISTKVMKVPSLLTMKANGSRIFFQIPESVARKQVSIKLFNIQGKLIRTLVDGNVEAGYHSVRLDRAGNSKSQIAAGLYLCRMEKKGYKKTINVLVKK
jgi:hypothetical protein